MLDTLRLYRSGILDRDEAEARLVDVVPGLRHAWGVEDAGRLVDEGVAEVYRAGNGWTVHGIAQELGVSERMVREWEEGLRPLHGTVGRRYAALLRPREAS